MNALKILLVIFIFLNFLSSSASAITWYPESFGGKLQLEEMPTWHSSPFGGQLQVTEEEGDNQTWHSQSFGGKAVVSSYVWGNWSDWWAMLYASGSYTLTGETPENNTVSVNITQPTVNVTIEEFSGGTFNWTITGTYITDTGQDAESNGSKSANVITPLPFSTNVVWFVTVTNGSSWTNVTYNFASRAQDVPDAPNTFIATTVNSTKIDLSWNKGNKADRTYIRYKDGAVAPADRTDGTFLYNNTGTSTSATALIYNTQYSFKAWSWNTTDSCYSTADVTDDNTTDAENQTVQFSDIYPANNSNGVSINLPNWSITITDPDGDIFNWTILVNNSDNADADDDTTGIKNCSLTTPLSYVTTYKVWVNATDDPAPLGNGTWVRHWYNFTTMSATGSAPVVTINTTTGIEETNATAHGYLETSTFDSDVQFNYSTLASYVGSSSTTPQAISEGNEFSYNISGLSAGTLYYHKVYAENNYGTNESGDLTFLTKPDPPTSLSVDYINHSIVSLSWTKGSGADNTYIERNATGISAPWTRGTGVLIYNITSNSYDDTSVVPSTVYYYQAWSYTSSGSLQQWSDENASVSDTTLPQPPQNADYTVDILSNNTANITITWDKGEGADYTLIRKATDSSPSSITDGTLLYNDTGTSVIDTFIEEPWLYTLWSFNETTNLYSELVTLGWYATWINVYNIINGSQEVSDWYVLISNDTGSTYSSDNNNNPLIINISLIPIGENVDFLFKASGYVDNTKNEHVSESQGFSLDVFMTPVTVVDPNPPVDPDSGEGQLLSYTKTFAVEDYTTDEVLDINRTIYEISSVEKYEITSENRQLHTDSKTVTDPTSDLEILLNFTFNELYSCTVYENLSSDNRILHANSNTSIDPASDLDITLNFTCDEIYRCVAYENLTSDITYTNSSTVTNPAIDVNISVQDDLEGIISVYRWNSSLYGGWELVDNANWAYDSVADNVTVNNSGLDANTTSVKCTYYTTSTGQGVTEIPISNNKISISGLTATIDKSVLTSWTDMVRIEYYEYDRQQGVAEVPVPGDKVSVVGLIATINSSVLTSDADMVQIQYYEVYSQYYQWIPIGVQNYTNTSDTVTVNASILNVNTHLLKVSYLSYISVVYIDTQIYLLRVVDEGEHPISDAKVSVLTYIEAFGSYQEVSSMLTDGNGQVEVYLIPGILYKVNITKDGYYPDTSSYVPTTEVFQHTFALHSESVYPLIHPTFNDLFTFVYGSNNNEIYFNVSSGIHTPDTLGFYIMYYANDSILFSDNVADSFNNFTYGIIDGYDYNNSYACLIIAVISGEGANDGSYSIKVYFVPTPGHSISQFDLDKLIEDVFGTSPVFNWDNNSIYVPWTYLIMLFAAFIVLVSFAKVNSFLGVMASGLTMLFFISFISLTAGPRAGGLMYTEASIAVASIIMIAIGIIGMLGGTDR